MKSIKLITMMLLCFCLVGCDNNKKSDKKEKASSEIVAEAPSEKEVEVVILSDKDKIAYNMILEICDEVNADSIEILSGVVLEMESRYYSGVFRLKHKNDTLEYFVADDTGAYKATELDDSLRLYVSDMLYDINFDRANVQKAVDDYLS